MGSRLKTQDECELKYFGEKKPKTRKSVASGGQPFYL